MLAPISYFFIVTGTLGLLLSLSLIVRSRRSNAPLLSLSILIAAMSVELLTNFAAGAGYVGRPDAVPFWLLGTYLVVPPSLLVVVRHSVGLQPLKRQLVGWMYVPAAVEFIAEALPYLFPWQAAMLMTQSALWFGITEIIPVVAVITILSWWVWQLYKRMVEDGMLFRVQGRLAVILSYYALISTLWFLEAAFGITLSGLTEILLGVAMLVVSYDAFTRTGSFEKLSLAGVRATSPWKYNDEASVERIRHLFNVEKCHCRSRFSLNDMAASLDLPPRYVSYLIGRHFGTNFSGLINRFRVQTVIDKFRDPAERHKTILAIAYEAGFNSKSTFNQVFKSQTGVSPSQYLKSCSDDRAVDS